MRKDVLICALGFLVLAGACQKEAEFQTDDTVKSVTFTITDFTDGDADTKTSFNEGGSFLWAPNDTVGIYPDTGSQVWFELTAGAEASSAQFDGGGWDFKASSMYYSYYPFVGDIYLDRNHIPVSYLGQKQTGTTSTSHIGQFDFMYTPGASSSSGNVNFRYRHLNSLLYVTATLPAGTYRKLAITAPTECFVEKGWYDLMADQPAIVAETYTNQMLIDLEDVTLSEQTTFRVYLMLAPVNLNGVEVTVSVLNAHNKELQCKKTPSREYVAGSYYGLTCSAFTQVPASEALIEDEPGSSPRNVIYYTSLPIVGKIVPSNSSYFGANIVSNEYVDGKGTITFDGDVTSIGNYAFRSCSGLTGITIPDSVTSIGMEAFYGCGDLKDITIPDAVTSIGKSAFAHCNSLTSITIPNSVTSIGGGAFHECSSLTSITIPNSVTSIDGSTFRGCSSLTSITIPNSVTSIGANAFDGCSSLTSITIPDSVTSIEAYAFYNCSSLTSFIIPEDVTSIKAYVFYGCSSLTSITIPDAVTNIGTYAFYNCSSLTSITIPETVTSIGGWAFYNCSGLTSITIPEVVTSIETATFEGCSSLTSFTIPDSVTSIGDLAFSDCSSLTSITIPEAVTSIEYYAFEGCSSLTSITIPEAITSIEAGTFEGCSSLTSITIPDAVTNIGTYAFYNCSSLTSITIPETVTSIGGWAFYNCSGLTNITLLSEAPPTGGEAMFDGSDCPIFVPAGSVGTYKSSTYWSVYEDRIQAIETEQPGTSIPEFGNEDM